MSNTIPGFINIPPLDISHTPENWILVEDCVYQSALPEWGGVDVNSAHGHVRGTPHLIVVYTGFECDLASIPRIFRFLIIKNGRHRAGAILHDFLCRLGKSFPRVLADQIFYEAMGVSQENRIRRKLMYWAVRLNTARLKLIGKAV